MASYTPITAFMDMPILTFWDFNNAICEVIKARREAAK